MGPDPVQWWLQGGYGPRPRERREERRPSIRAVTVLPFRFPSRVALSPPRRLRLSGRLSFWGYGRQGSDPSPVPAEPRVPVPDDLLRSALRLLAALGEVEVSRYDAGAFLELLPLGEGPAGEGGGQRSHAACLISRRAAWRIVFLRGRRGMRRRQQGHGFRSCATVVRGE
jgi:hypothetical protein